MALAAALASSLIAAPHAQQGRAPAAPPTPAVRSLHVQGNVWMISAGVVNVAVQIGDQGVLLVDSGTEAAADAILAEVRRLAGDKPIRYIVNTHAHPDHTGGNAAIKEATGCRITGPAAEYARIPTLDVQVRGGDKVRLGDHVADVWDVPAHTAGHVAYHFPGDGTIFVGDTMFAMGCGRLFEGTAEQMFDNMRKLDALDDATRAAVEAEARRRGMEGI